LGFARFGKSNSGVCQDGVINSRRWRSGEGGGEDERDPKGGGGVYTKRHQDGHMVDRPSGELGRLIAVVI